jgi:hypothetical protein
MAASNNLLSPSTPAESPATGLSAKLRTDLPADLSDALPDAPAAALPAPAADESVFPATELTLPIPEAELAFNAERARDFAPKPQIEDSEWIAGVGPMPIVPGQVELAPQGGRIELNGLLAMMDRPAPFSRPNTPGSGRYQVTALLIESLDFQNAENVFRLITDPNMRHLTADKPYWHDYISSLKQWNMRRWWDGDDFLVDYIGHPMEGGVASFIEIQNSPRQRALEFGMDREYWRSRFLGMLWATVYSTQQKLGPMGEAALGSDGGITYPLNCPYPCRSYKPGVTKYTNNTGWTDLIATPVIGTLWVLLEDILDREISDRVQHGNMDAVLPKILRGAINPCRTMANAMRGRKPWYRDFQPEQARLIPAVHFYPGDPDVVEHAPRYELFPHYAELYLPVNTPTCTNCRRWVSGPGIGAAIRLNKWVAFDSDLTYASNASPLPSDRAGGNMTSGTFGIRGGVEYKHFALGAAVRPGFVSYGKAYESIPVKDGPTPSEGRITHFAAALAVNGDYNITRHLAFRMVIDNTAVRYKTDKVDAPGIGMPPYLNWLSKQNFLTNENWGYKTGAVVRF